MTLAGAQSLAAPSLHTALVCLAVYMRAVVELRELIAFVQ